MQRFDRQLLHEADEAQVENTNHAHEQGQADEMHRHHERPPPFAGDHGVGELVGRRLKSVNHGPDGSLNDRPVLAPPNFRMPDVAAGVPGSCQKAHGHDRAKQERDEIRARRLWPDM